MLMLTAAQNAQPDYVALAMVLALAVIVTIMVIRKHLMLKKRGAAPLEIPSPAVLPQIPAAPGSAGQLKLHDVEPKTAAMLMAIVADKMGKPLNELRFISIKEVL